MADKDKQQDLNQEKLNSENEVVEEVNTRESLNPDNDDLNEGNLNGDNELEILKSQLKEAKEEAEKNYDTALRTQAELENVRKRNREDVEKAHKFATEKFARELLNVADSFDSGLKSSQENATVESLIEGMKLIQQQLFKVFEDLNIEIIEAEGDKFNPELHEAMASVPNPDLEDNTVMEVIQKGYTLNQRLLRPSKVVVSKKD